MFGKVIIALDGSPLALGAAAVAKRFGLLEGAEVLAVTAFDSHEARFRQFWGVSRERLDALHEKLKSKVLEPGCEALRALGIEVSEALMIDGDPAEVLCAEASRREADLIVLGRRGLGNIQRFFLGSVSLAVMRGAPCEVLIVPQTEEPGGGLEELCAATDFSACAEVVTTLGERLSRELGVRLTLLHAVAPLSAFPDDEINREVLGDLESLVLKEAREQLGQLASKLGSEVQSKVELGRPELILAEHSRPESLLLLASRRPKLAERLLLGSTTERVVGLVSGPVLLTRECSA